MFGIQFNAGRSRQAIGEAMRLMGDMTPVFQDVTEYLVRAHRQRFVQGKGPDGTAWAPKSAATLARYEKLGYGTLSKALIGPGKRLSREILSFTTPNSSTVGSSLIYSGVMQGGAAKGAFGADRRGRPIPWGRIPARVIFGLSREEDADVVDIVEEHLEGRLDAG